MREILADVPLTRLTWHLLQVTQVAFIIGLSLVAFLGVLSIFRIGRKPSNHAMERTADRSGLHF
jgi:hypothetical protein